MTEPAEMDRHTILTVQRAIRKSRKVRCPALHDAGILYCIRCLRNNYEVKAMIYEPFFTICDECVRNLAIFMEHVIREKQGHTQAQSEPDEGQSEMGGEPEVA